MPNRARSAASALLTDLYQLTMAYAYWKSGRADLESVFHLFFRKHPFHGGFTLAAGLTDALAFIRDFHFAPEDLEYLASLRGGDQRPLFEPGFLEYLQALKLRVDVDAVTEGTVVFPHEPLLRVRGAILQCQLLETALLNLINFQTLVATKAARICLAARGDPVIEFGLRRAQGPDGALSAARAAYLGGCEATSNVLAGQVLGLPVLGTHAHSWVMCFSDELEAFETYARAMPNNCVFLVDTYDSLEGVRHAVRAGRWLRERGHELAGIRLDSGDLAYLSIQARKILDEGGFPKARIVASNDLDEHIIASLKEQGATVNVWGVGTKLVTAYDDPALGGVYKLSAVKAVSGRWEHKLKLSEQAVKITTPGILQVRRYRVGDEYREDMIYDLADGFREPPVIVDPLDPTRRKSVAAGTPHEDLLVPVVREGRCVYASPALPEIRARAKAQLGLFHPGVKRFVNPHQFPVGLELGLHELKTRLILEARARGR